jgi:hypothetical protein
MSDKPDILDALFEINRQKLETIQAYVEGGGLERVVETTSQFYKLMDEQLRLIELIANRDKL